MLAEIQPEDEEDEAVRWGRQVLGKLGSAYRADLEPARRRERRTGPRALRHVWDKSIRE